MDGEHQYSWCFIGEAVVIYSNHLKAEDIQIGGNGDIKQCRFIRCISPWGVLPPAITVTYNIPVSIFAPPVELLSTRGDGFEGIAYSYPVKIRSWFKCKVGPSGVVSLSCGIVADGINCSP